MSQRRRPFGTAWHWRQKRRIRANPAACHLCSEQGADVPLFTDAGALPVHAGCRRTHLREVHRGS